MLPNPGKPAELKRAIGSRNYRPAENVVLLEQPGVTPVPLRQLSDAGLEFFNSVYSHGASWISHRTDIHLVQITAEQLDEREYLRELVDGDADAWRERAALRELEKVIISNLSKLGFSPTDRMKLGVAEVKTVSKLEQLMQRKAEMFDGE